MYISYCTYTQIHIYTYSVHYTYVHYKYTYTHVHVHIHVHVLTSLSFQQQPIPPAHRLLTVDHKTSVEELAPGQMILIPRSVFCVRRMNWSLTLVCWFFYLLKDHATKFYSVTNSWKPMHTCNYSYAMYAMYMYM